MGILSVNSHVAYGHVGNAVAVFALQRLGNEVWPVNTVQFSNHPGYGAFRGAAADPALVRDVLQGIEERGAFSSCDGILSGYLASSEVGEAVVEAVARVKRANPAARYCCDPVLGDDGRTYVHASLPEFMRTRLVPVADIVTPNQFELELLTGRTSATRRDAIAAVDALHAMGPGIVLVSSLRIDETPADAIDVLVSDGGERWRIRTPRVGLSANGAGDLLAALFLARWLASGSLPTALSRAVSSLFGIVRRTAEANSRELLIVAAQDELIAPSRIFEAERM